MRVYLRPQRTLSFAMERVADALERHAPSGVEIVKRPRLADLQLLHVVGDGSDALSHLEAPSYAVAQYCFGTVSRDEREDPASRLAALWNDAKLIWSYYDIADVTPEHVPFYLSPLGVDDAFKSLDGRPMRTLVMTSGYVSGPGAEAIEEVARAAHVLGLPVQHLGPSSVKGMTFYPRMWQAVDHISDSRLADIYRRSLWVSGLRHVEAFELPVIEGLCCGARPIVFDRPDMRRWYDGHAVFVRECSGEELVDQLIIAMREGPWPVHEPERQWALQTFDWATIARGFWEHLP